MTVENLIDALANGNNAQAKTEFESEIATRVIAALDAKRAEVAQAMFNQAADSNENS
jgi:hypothetical protein